MKELVLPSVLVLVLSAGVPAVAEDSPATRLSLKGLEGIGIRVAPIAPQAEKDGLSARAIHAAVESRIRRAGIRVLTPEQQRRILRRPCLRVNVATSKLKTGEHLYWIRLELNQWVASLGNPKVMVAAATPLPATTWSPAGVLGIAPADQIGRDVHGAVGAMVEEFIGAFFKANPSETALRARSVSRPR